MTKAEMVHTIQVRYQEAIREYREVCKPGSFSQDLATRKLAHLNEVRYIANLLGIELRTPQDEPKPQKEE